MMFEVDFDHFLLQFDQWTRTLHQQMVMDIDDPLLLDIIYIVFK